MMTSSTLVFSYMSDQCGEESGSNYYAADNVLLKEFNSKITRMVTFQSLRSLNMLLKISHSI